MDLLLRGSVTLRNFEGMVPTFDDIERCTQAMARDYFADFFSGSESIARALDKKHGRLDVFQVGVAFRQATCEQTHERAQLVSTGAVAKDDSYARMILLRRSVKQCG